MIFRTEGIPGAEMIFRCSYCPKTLTKTSPVEKPYGCSECSKTFPRKTGLQSHLIKHTEVNPFICFRMIWILYKSIRPSESYAHLHRRSPTAALNVPKPLLGILVWSSMLDFLQGKNHLNVSIVAIHLADKIIWIHMLEFAQGKTLQMPSLCRFI